MKKLFVAFAVLFLSFGLVACGEDEKKVRANENKDYYAAGQITNWGDGFAEFKMEAIALGDARIASIKKELKGVQYLYVLEIVLPDEDAGWNEDVVVGEETINVNGNLSVKVIRTNKDDADAVDFWAQNKESGEITNLTPDTLYMPKYRETDTEEDGLGTWAGNPFALEAGTYYLVFAEKGAGANAVRFMGLIKK